MPQKVICARLALCSSATNNRFLVEQSDDVVDHTGICATELGPSGYAMKTNTAVMMAVCVGFMLTLPTTLSS